MVSHGYVIMSLSSELETFQTNIDFWSAVTRFQLKYFRIYLANWVQSYILGLVIRTIINILSITIRSQLLEFISGKDPTVLCSNSRNLPLPQSDSTQLLTGDSQDSHISQDGRSPLRLDKK